VTIPEAFRKQENGCVGNYYAIYCFQKDVPAKCENTLSNITVYYQLRKALDENVRRTESCQEALAQAKYDLRAAKVALAEYGGVTALLDKLRGRYEERKESLEQALRTHADTLAARKRETEELAYEKQTLETKLQAFPGEAVLLTDTQIHTPALRYYAEKLLACLDDNTQSLNLALQFARPGIGLAEEIRDNRIRSLARADRDAGLCLDLLRRLSELGSDLEIHPYFLNPAGYIMGVAAEFRQLDRLNSALKAVSGTKKAVTAFLKEV